LPNQKKYTEVYQYSKSIPEEEIKLTINQLVSTYLSDATTALIGILVAFLVAYVKRHFSASQIKTGTEIATEAVNFAAQMAKRFGITDDATRYNSALARVKDLASKAGVNLSDSQWETLIESAWRKVKDGLNQLQGNVIAAGTETLDTTSFPANSAPIADTIQQARDQVGEQAKAQAIDLFNAKLSAVVQDATQPAQSIPDIVQQSA